MKIITLLPALCCVVFWGCHKKFDHTNVIPTSCELCAYTDQLEGRYIGIVSGPKVNAETGSFSDSMRVRIEHVFKSHGTYVDSTVMYLKLTQKYHSQNDSTSFVFEMHALNNYTYLDSKDGLSQFLLTPDTMEIKMVNSHYGSNPTTVFHFNGSRE